MACVAANAAKRPFAIHVSMLFLPRKSVRMGTPPGQRSTETGMAAFVLGYHMQVTRVLSPKRI